MGPSFAPATCRLSLSRWLVLALLSLCLPLQGALAATMGIGMALMPVPTGAVVATMPKHCEDMAAMAAEAADDGVAMAQADHHAHGGPGGHLGSVHAPVGADAGPDVDHPLAMAHHGVSATGDHAAGHGDDTPSSDHHCGICLQCCIGAAIPVAPLILAAQQLRDAAPTLGAIGAPEQLPQSLDRPPKTFLA